MKRVCQLQAEHLPDHSQGTQAGLVQCAIPLKVPLNSASLPKYIMLPFLEHLDNERKSNAVQIFSYVRLTESD